MLGPVVALDALHLHGYIADRAYRSQLLSRLVSVAHTLHPALVCHCADGSDGHYW